MVVIIIIILFNYY